MKRKKVVKLLNELADMAEKQGAPYGKRAVRLEETKKYVVAHHCSLIALGIQFAARCINDRTDKWKADQS